MGDLVYEVPIGERAVEQLGEYLGIEGVEPSRYIEMPAPSHVEADYLRLLE